MKLLYIHQYFLTPREPGPTRSYWLARQAVSSGHQVTVVAGRSGQQKAVEREKIDGIDVIYIRNAYNNKMGYLRRILSFIRFMFLSLWVSLKEKKVDLVFATSTPLSVGLTALMLKWLKRKPYIFEVRDLWPEAPIQMGIIRNKFLITILRKAESLIYSSASHIIALSPGMMKGVLSSGINDSKVSLIPNMAKKSEFFPRRPDLQMAKQFGINVNHFNAAYAGAFGVANGLDYIIDAALLLKNEGVTDVDILFVGTGKREWELMKRCSELQLENVKFLGAHPLIVVSEILNLCDCSLVTFSDIPILYTNSPNKLFDSLAAAKPVIVNSNGWTREIVEKNVCGTYVDPNKPEELKNALIRMKNDAELMRRMSANSRRLAEEVYDKSILTPRFISIIERYAV